LSSEIAKMFAAADKLPLGEKRDELLWKAMELQARLKVERWVNSSGLRPPRGTRGED